MRALVGVVLVGMVGCSENAFIHDHECGVKDEGIEILEGGNLKSADYKWTAADLPRDADEREAQGWFTNLEMGEDELPRAWEATEAKYTDDGIPFVKCQPNFRVMLVIQ